jgi:CRP/FNR family transcriptional regulator
LAPNGAAGLGPKALERAGARRYHEGMDDIAFLREKVALFAGVSEENLAALAARAFVNTYKKNQTVFFQGTTVDGLHIVTAGRVSVLAKAAGRSAVRIAELGPGEVFGETSIVMMGTAGATVKAAEDDTVVLIIPQDAFHRILQQDEAFAVRVNTLIVARQAPPVALPA